MKKIFITYKLPGKPELLLKKKGFDISVHSKKENISKEELIKKAKEANAIITLLSNKIDKEIIDSLPKLKIIANCAVGFNNIDVEYARSKNIIVTNTPGILTNATADITVGLVIVCARRFHEAEKIMRENNFTGWKPDLLLGMELSGKTFGLIGAGRIGQAVGKRMKSFGTKIIYFNNSRKIEFEEETCAKKVSLNYLLKNSDIVSIHLPLNNSTFRMLNKEKLLMLKKNSILINTARGEIVDEKFLVKLLKGNRISAAGFDVYEGEPEVNPDLLKLKNVFLLPHLGSATVETRTAMSLLCAENVASVLSGKAAITPV